MASLGERLGHAWNAFLNKDPPAVKTYPYIGSISSFKPDRYRLTRGNDRSIVTSVVTRIAVDIASTTIQHVKLDDKGRFGETIDSGLNSCLNLSANIDQTGRAFIEDCALTMMDEGVVAIVPVDTDKNPLLTESYQIKSMRAGRVVEWFPDRVRVNVYNDRLGKRQDIILPKRVVAIVENPLYPIMNEPNSTWQRLAKKLALLDYVDEESGAGRLDLIIQLPYTIKSEARRQQAEARRKEIEMQLAGSKYGIAYTDGTEHITQLNRSLDNHLMDQVKYLTDLAFGQIGMTMEILNGSADEATMLNYNNRIIEPMVAAIVDAIRWKFLSKTARSQQQTIMYFRDPFKLTPTSQMADIADKFTRNEILSSNEIRQLIGMKPVDDPKADELRNKNLNPGDEQEFASTKDEEGRQIQNE